MKLARTLAPIVSSSRALQLGERASQAWKPDRETPSASHSHATGQMPRCFAMKTNFIALPSRSRLRPFLGYRAPLRAWSPHAAAARSPAARASSALGQERLEPG